MSNEREHRPGPRAERAGGERDPQQNQRHARQGGQADNFGDRQSGQSHLQDADWSRRSAVAGRGNAGGYRESPSGGSGSWGGGAQGGGRGREDNQGFAGPQGYQGETERGEFRGGEAGAGTGNYYTGGNAEVPREPAAYSNYGRATGGGSWDTQSGSYGSAWGAQRGDDRFGGGEFGGAQWGGDDRGGDDRTGADAGRPPGVHRDDDAWRGRGSHQAPDGGGMWGGWGGGRGSGPAGGREGGYVGGMERFEGGSGPSQGHEGGRRGAVGVERHEAGTRGPAGGPRHDAGPWQGQDHPQGQRGGRSQDADHREPHGFGGGYGQHTGVYGYESPQQQGQHGQPMFDPEYQQWREQQMRELDTDYTHWRRERYEKFSQEFNDWRDARRRNQQRAAAGDPVQPENAGGRGFDSQSGSAHRGSTQGQPAGLPGAPAAPQAQGGLGATGRNATGHDGGGTGANASTSIGENSAGGSSGSAIGAGGGPGAEGSPSIGNAASGATGGGSKG